MGLTAGEPVYFESPAALGRWFASHGATATELHVGFTKTHTGRAGLTWPQSVDEALCAGWIDGVRHRVDDERYRIRFTPRKPTSHWSTVNVKRFEALRAEGRVTAAGEAAFARRSEERTGRASYEQSEAAELSAAQLRELRRHKAAWAGYQALPPGERQRVTWKVVSAKQEATQGRRLALLIECCAKGVRMP